MLRPALVLAFAACTMPNPAYDEPGGGGSGDGSTPGTDPATAGPTGAPNTDPAPTSTAGTGTAETGPASGTTTSGATVGGSVDTTTGADTSSDTTVDATTTGMTTGMTAGTTSACDACVDECRRCEADQCVPDPGATCTMAVPPACEALVAGLEVTPQTVSCVALQTTGKSCTGQGTCAYDCAPGGPPIVSCDAVCALQDPICQYGAPVQDVSVGALCFVDVPVPGCSPTCENAGQPTYTDRRCNGAGLCETSPMKSCGNYKCNAAGCYTGCGNDGQCAGFAHCDAGQCVPFIPP